MKLKHLIALLLVFNTVTSMAQNADAVLGIWQSEHGSARVQISKSGSNYDGKIVWLKDGSEAKTDENNPSESLRKRPILGMQALSDFVYKGNGSWEGGTVYDPRTGKKYSAKLAVNGSGALEIRAFMGISLIGKTQVWSRVK